MSIEHGYKSPEPGSLTDYKNPWDSLRMIISQSGMLDLIPSRIPTYAEYVEQKGGRPELLLETAPKIIEILDKIAKEFNENRDKMISEKDTVQIGWYAQRAIDVINSTGQ